MEQTFELKKSESKYRTLVETAKDAIISADLGAWILTWNKAAEEIYGWKEIEAVGKHFGNLTSLAYRNYDKESVLAELKEKGFWRGEVTQNTKDGRTINVLASLSITRDEHGEPVGMVGVHRDITEQVKAAEKLSRSEIRYRGLVESQKDLIIRFNPKGLFTFVNDAYCKKFGKKREDLIGNSFMPFIHEDDQYSTLEEMKKLEKPPYRIYIEQRALTAEGIRWLGWEDYAIKDDSGNTVEIQAVGRDITEKKQADKLRSISIYQNIEVERKRISRDLHDYLGQMLTSAKLKLEVFRHRNEISDNQFDESLNIISRSGKVLRDIVHDLHPLEIEKYGLIASLQMFCEEVSKDSNISIKLKTNGSKFHFDQKNELMIFRIVQEAINNIIRHSGSTKAQILLEKSDNNFQVIIADNGSGFLTVNNAEESNSSDGFGLINMKQRAELIGGKLSINSEVDKGTIIKLRVLL